MNLKNEIQNAIINRKEWAIKTLEELVRFPSVLGNEENAQLHLAGVYDSLGYKTLVEPIRVDRIKNLPGFSPVDWQLEGKKNVVAIHDPGVNQGRSLAFNGHIDVVSPEPVKMWQADPFDPRIVKNEEDGEDWMYGRGAGDMKSGTVCYLWALAALQDLGFEPSSKVICQSPVEEECTGNGALAILERGHLTDACLIPEPFNETILTSQIGVMWFQVRIVGKTTHVLGAGRGVNAIEKSWLIIDALRQLEAEINQPDKIHADYKDVDHPINLNVGVIRGGDWASTVAGECLTRFRIGLFPGEKCEDMKKKIEKCVAEVAQIDPWLKEFPPQVEYIGFQAEGCDFDVKSDFAGVLKQSHQIWRGNRMNDYKCTCTTDVRFYNLYYDIPATCYGPKAVNIHGVDEKVSLNSMQRVTEVIASLIEQWCGLRKK